jgi:amidohydrolase
VAAAVVDPEAETFMKEAIEETLGAQYMAGAIKSTGGDDFHFYTVEKPKLKATMLGLGCGLKPGLHHPDMTFDRRALLAGVRILTRVVMKTLESFGKGGGRHG